MAFYELVYIVRPDVATNQVEAVAKKFADIVKDKGGKVAKTEQWGLKSLAYRVKKHRKGYYTMMVMEANGDIVKEVERNLRINDDVIRFLTVSIEEVSKEPSVQMQQPRRRPNTDAPVEA